METLAGIAWGFAVVCTALVVLALWIVAHALIDWRRARRKERDNVRT